ncbi:MAG: oleandomycin transport system ATP-binding protein, partial [Actinomycetota bacterium]|nr:oleandomycin transport system ATP-binding protein [Actinomycetota bacterium]
AQLGKTVIEMEFRGDGRAEQAMGLLTGSLGNRLERADHTLRITSDSGARVLIDALRSLDGVGLEPDGLTVREPSIDDVFLALTGHRAEEPSGETIANEG